MTLPARALTGQQIISSEGQRLELRHIGRLFAEPRRPRCGFEHDGHPVVELGAQLRTGVSRSDSKGAYDVAVAAGSAVRIDRGAPMEHQASAAKQAVVIGGSLGGLFAGLLLRSIRWDVDM